MLHSVGVFHPPPLLIRDVHTGRILALTGNAIAGMPPTTIMLPAGAGIADTLLSPRAQCDPRLVALQHHFVATPATLFDVAVTPPLPAVNLPAF